MYKLPNEYGEPGPIEDIIEQNVSDRYLVPDKLLKRANILDICYRDSKRSCCFTKAYSHYVEGTGSVFTEASPEFLQKCYNKANTFESNTNEFINSLKLLKLRFFTPKEVSALMSFPKYYKFPTNITVKQQYRLLGNSVNVRVISELLKILFE